ncbi:MAG: leucine-rich repeat protein [Erysipelotrichaceae bacterium]|nr:leucine-rich repeat protein [Erysipelotrichaceae bacterium]
MIVYLDKMKRGVIMECCNCHRQIESNYEYCPFCGTKQAVPAPGEPHFKNPSQLVQVNSEFVAIGPYELKEESESGDYTITLVRVNLNDIEDLYFPDHVRKIGPDSFAGAKNLKTIVIPQGVIEIGAGAFKDCPNLTNVVIAPSVLVIGAYAFDGCYEYNYLRDELYIRSLPEFVLPEGIRELEAAAFYNSGFRAIVLPATLKKIGAHAFGNCIHLERIANIAHVDRVGEDICSGCKRLGDPETLAGIAMRNQ